MEIILERLQKVAGRALLALAVLFPLCEVSPVEAQSCGSSGLAVQVLGSGGPELQDKRASTSYLIWDHGTARVIVDAGRVYFRPQFRDRSEGTHCRVGDRGIARASRIAILDGEFATCAVAIAGIALTCR